MDALLNINRQLHIALGFIGLAAFWLPILSAKGGLLHRSSGLVFRYCGLLVVVTAMAGVGLYLIRLIQGGASPSQAPESWSFLLFLGYLAIITGISLSHGLAVLHHKRDLRALNTPYRTSLAYLALGSSVVIIAWALYWRPDNMWILLALSPIGLGNGWALLKLYHERSADPRTWLYEHLNAMLGAGIAFHTAFAVFGFNRFFEYQLPGTWQVVPWVLPAAIGIPAGMLWTRHYRRGAPIRRR